MRLAQKMQTIRIVRAGSGLALLVSSFNGGRSMSRLCGTKQNEITFPLSFRPLFPAASTAFP
jgi:hypothetical protein